MPVFISHSSKDDAHADRLSRWLTANGVSNFNDGFDERLRSTEDITKSILSRIDSCTHLMVVFTTNTQSSWWVPFEIGAGSHKNSFLSTWLIGWADFPEYLENWPKLITQEHLDEYVRQYKLGGLRIAANRAILEKSESARRDMAAEFHTTMRRYTGQIR